jgi:hypothetical protein
MRAGQIVEHPRMDRTGNEQNCHAVPAREEGARLAGPNGSAIPTKSLKMPKATDDRFTNARATRNPAPTSSSSTILDPKQKQHSHAKHDGHRDSECTSNVERESGRIAFRGVFTHPHDSAAAAREKQNPKQEARYANNYYADGPLALSPRRALSRAGDASPVPPQWR